MPTQSRKKKEFVEFQKRGTFLFFVVFLFSLFLLTNLFFLQILRGEYYREQAEHQYLGYTGNTFRRGSIFFQGLNRELTIAAGQKQGEKLIVNAQKISKEDLRTIYPLLKKLSYQKSFEETWNLLMKLKRNGNRYYELIRHIDSSDNDSLRKIIKELDSFSLDPDTWRFYPFQESGAQTIGFLANGDDNLYRGRYGLERFYDEILQRKDEQSYENFFVLLFRGLKDGGVLKEGDVITSIDPEIQFALDEQIQAIHTKWNSQLTGGFIMDAQNGEIYGIDALPSYDPNTFSRFSLSRFRNPLVSNHYEFGSVMKPIVMAIALDNKFVTADTSYYDRGSVQVGKHTIRNFDNKGRGWVTMQDVLNQSLNTGMVFVSKKIPKKVFRDYFRRYGFTEKSGIDLPGDGPGLTQNLKSPRDIEFANMSFGQGIALSPVSFVKGFSALAHGGVPVQPHVMRSIHYTSGIEQSAKVNEETRVLSEETAGEISRMLVNVFDSYHGGKWKFPHYRIAAKTGTAQLAKPGGGYDEKKHLHSFVAYFPAYQPRYIVFLFTVDPKGVKYSSQTLIEPFRNLARFLINYAQIPPDR